VSVGLAWLVDIDTCGRQWFAGRVFDAPGHDRGQSRVRNRGLTHELAVMGSGRNVASGLGRIIEIPETEEVRLLSGKLLEHGLADLLRGALDSPDAELADLAC
jgi:hypothetical protein